MLRLLGYLGCRWLEKPSGSIVSAIISLSDELLGDGRGRNWSYLPKKRKAYLVAHPT